MTGKIFYEDVAPGSEIPSLVKYPTTMQLVKFAGASGDFYQIHYDKDFALASGLPSVIVHGWLALSFLGQMLADWMGENGTLVRLSGSYKGMNLVDEEIFCYGRVAKKYDEAGRHLVRLGLWAENPRGERTVAGAAVVALPSRLST
jgi:acyl dehydratase